jgi:hypothetical protein
MVIIDPRTREKEGKQMRMRMVFQMVMIELSTSDDVNATRVTDCNRIEYG